MPLFLIIPFGAECFSGVVSLCRARQCRAAKPGGPAKATYLYSFVEYNNAFKFLKMGYASALSWFMFLIMLVITLGLFRSSRRWVYSSSERGDIL